VIEAGGGTGFQRPLWGAAYTYVCLDIDLVKLVGFRKKFPQGLAVLGDATQLPFPSESADATVCVFLIHHLGDDMLPELMAELQRVLKPGGLLLLAEPDKAMDRPLTRLLWRLDRGSHPRSLDEIQAILRKHFQVVEAERTKMLHPFLIFVCETLDGNPVPQPG
jgi:ubiquinone/menaquinone biosynthesis C-methylase UbiE